MNAEEAREIYTKTPFERLMRRIEDRSVDGLRNASIELPVDFTAREVNEFADNLVALGYEVSRTNIRYGYVYECVEILVRW